MREIILCKLGEVVLKGLNRHSFETKLMSNIRRRTQKFGKFRIYSRQSTIYVEPMEDSCDLAGAYAGCKQVFGLIAIARAVPCEKSKEAILDTARAYLGDELRKAKSFKVETKRADKSFPMGSIEISQWVGGMLHDAFPHLKVDVHDPELTVYVEVREDAAYVHAPAEPAAGGLPLGMGGSALSLLSGGIDSPVAGYCMMKRGVRCCAIHFQSPPYTGELARDKVMQLAKEMAEYSGGMRVYLVPFTKCQLEIHEKCPEGLGTLITRRFMMRIAQEIAKQNECNALITGESLGQVASQTMESIVCTDAVCEMPVFRPLIGMDKTEIMDIAKRIGTYETSILPYEDCCTVFTPRHPVTKPKLDTMPKAESKLDIEALVREAVEGTELVIVS